MKPHKPWQPHVSNESLLNPFAPATEAAQPIQRIEIEPEEEAGEGEEAGKEGAPRMTSLPPAEDEWAGG